MKRTLSLIAAILIAIYYVYGDASSNNTTQNNGASEAVESNNSPSYSQSQSPVSPSAPLLPAQKIGLSERILVRKAYTVSYNKLTMQPNWAAWTIEKNNVLEENMKYDRPSYNAFHEDEEVSSPRATLDDYRGSGLTRGHMCPSGDCRWDEDVLYETFLLTNICPQTRALNAGVWNDIEKSCRRWAIRYGRVYVVCGPIFFKKSEKGTIGRNKIPVPDAFFKVVLCLEGDKPKGIGFVCRNQEGESPDAGTSANGRKRTKKELYIHSIDEVERITGYDFFASLPDDVENEVESFAEYEKW